LSRWSQPPETTLIFLSGPVGSRPHCKKLLLPVNINILKQKNSIYITYIYTQMNIATQPLLKGNFFQESFPNISGEMMLPQESM
jgi:hypothetical protein